MHSNKLRIMAMSILCANIVADILVQAILVQDAHELARPLAASHPGRSQCPMPRPARQHCRHQARSPSPSPTPSSLTTPRRASLHAQFVNTRTATCPRKMVMTYGLKSTRRLNCSTPRARCLTLLYYVCSKPPMQPHRHSGKRSCGRTNYAPGVPGSRRAL